jgi:hypothetical protein
MNLANGKAVAQENPVPVTSSAVLATAVTPHDTNDLAGGLTKGIYIGGSGDLKVTFENGSSATFTALSAGVIHPIAAKKIQATGTTATNILAVY